MNRDVVQRYVKRPVVVSAIQFNDANVELIREFTGGKLSAFHRKNNHLYVNTLEGLMMIHVDDYIVRGIKGEFYPVTKEIFELTYEELNDGDAKTEVQL